MSAPIPCRICGCLDGEPGLCHAVTASGKACTRPAAYPDWCTACASWEKDLKKLFPDNAPLEAFASHYRAQRAYRAAEKRGASVPGSYALRVHGARMLRQCNRILAEKGFIDPAYKKPAPEEWGDGPPLKPICPASL